MDIHFPVATVELSIVEFKLEGASIPDMIITLRNGDGILWPTLHDPVPFLFVSIPQHEAAFLKARANENNFFVDVAIGKSAKEIIKNCTSLTLYQLSLKNVL